MMVLLFPEPPNIGVLVVGRRMIEKGCGEEALFFVAVVAVVVVIVGGVNAPLRGAATRFRARWRC